jgi:hypothetical protein
MFSTLESLVLRGVSVQRDGQTVELRLGTSAEDTRKTPEIRISMRHPRAYPAGFMPAERPDHAAVQDGVVRAVCGAGRPLGLAGVSGCRNPARIAGRITPGWWSGPVGGPKSAAVSYLRLLRARPETSARVANSERPNLLNVNGLQGRTLKARWRSTVKVAWPKPATRTPPGSTRGIGAR